MPLVLWTRWPYNLAEAFATVYARLQHAVEAGELARPGEVLPVLATPHGLRAPRYVHTSSGGPRLRLYASCLQVRGLYGPSTTYIQYIWPPSYLCDPQAPTFP